MVMVGLSKLVFDYDLVIILSCGLGKNIGTVRPHGNFGIDEFQLPPNHLAQ